MIADGFVGEVQRLLDQGYERSLRPMQSLGYRHLAAHLSGEMDLEGAIRLIKRDTRRYAKRQMTWFATEREIIWLAPDDLDAAEERIDRFLCRQEDRRGIIPSGKGRSFPGGCSEDSLFRSGEFS